MRRRRIRRAPAPIPAGCPDWCTVEHDLAEDLADGMRLHERPIGRWVAVVATDDLQAGTRSPAEVFVRAVEVSTVVAARKLALAIVEASEYLDGAR